MCTPTYIKTVPMMVTCCGELQRGTRRKMPKTITKYAVLVLATPVLYCLILFVPCAFGREMQFHIHSMTLRLGLTMRCRERHREARASTCQCCIIDLFPPGSPALRRIFPLHPRAQRTHSLLVSMPAGLLSAPMFVNSQSSRSRKYWVHNAAGSIWRGLPSPVLKVKPVWGPLQPSGGFRRTLFRVTPTPCPYKWRAWLRKAPPRPTRELWLLASLTSA